MIVVSIIYTRGLGEDASNIAGEEANKKKVTLEHGLRSVPFPPSGSDDDQGLCGIQGRGYWVATAFESTIRWPDAGRGQEVERL